MIPQATIDKIHEAARVEEIVQDFIALKKRGVNYVVRSTMKNHPRSRYLPPKAYSNVLVAVLVAMA
jgi:hypothetical protein